MAEPGSEPRKRVGFAEPPSRPNLTTEYINQLKQLLPGSWRIYRDGVWVHARAHREGDVAQVPRAQGFKIHLSAAPFFVDQVLRLVVPVCIEHGVDFKIIGDPSLHEMLDSKRQPRGHSGKFMTIYPSDDDGFVMLIEKLHHRTRDAEVAGPRILSDRQYKDNPVLYYRYGGINPPQSVKIDGTRATHLVAPDGEYIIDERLPYFLLPSWVNNPFGFETPDQGGADVLLGDRYLVASAVGFSNTGGQYRAMDTRTGAAAFVKEARPWTNCWGRYEGRGARDAVYLLRREYGILQKLRGLDFVPEPLDLLDESGHLFLVEDYIPATTMRKYWALNEVMLIPYVRLPGRIDMWMDRFRIIAAELIRMVLSVHQLGVLIGDLSVDNILIDPDTMRMWLVDFECSVRESDDPDIMLRAAGWGTPGFVAPQRAGRGTLSAEDDLFAAGMVLYYGLAAITSLFTLDPTAIERFLLKFTSLGVPPVVGDTIRSLLQGDAEKALELLEESEQ